MPLTYDHSPSGLVFPPGTIEASVRMALKHHDSALKLDYANDTDWGGRQVWQVLKKVSAEGHVEVVCRWRDPITREPLPLSHGLVDHVKTLDLNSRAPKLDADAENARHRARLEAEADAEIEFYAAELVDRLRGKKAYLLPRGASRRARQFPNVTEIR